MVYAASSPNDPARPSLRPARPSVRRTNRSDSNQPGKGHSVGAALALCLLLSACTGHWNQGAEHWPDQLPARSHYVNAYENDPRIHPLQTREHYLRWIVNFYQGTLWYRNGWNDLVPDLLAEADTEQQAQLWERKLYKLGRDISTEWAKNKNYRRIHNYQLSVWGNAVSKAIAEEEDIEATIDRIAQDVEALIAGGLEPKAISGERYFPEDQNDVFAF